MEYGPLNRMTETTEGLKSGVAPAGGHFCGVQVSARRPIAGLLAFEELSRFRQAGHNPVVSALRYRLRSFVWVALIAMCGVALGPTISRALGPVATSSDGMSAHCMEMGSHMQMPKGAPAEHSHGPGHSSNPLDCCALCAVAASPFTGVAVFLPQLAAGEAAPPPPADRSGAGPHQRALWSSAAPRGPPSLS
jgi:Protein of unknown function (DUF2946)